MNVNWGLDAGVSGHVRSLGSGGGVGIVLGSGGGGGIELGVGVGGRFDGSVMFSILRTFETLGERLRL